MIGRLDPKTGEDQKFMLPTRANFAPNPEHTIDFDAGAGGPINKMLLCNSRSMMEGAHHKQRLIFLASVSA